MRILITGISGMLGTDLAEELTEDHEIIGGDIRNPAAVLNISFQKLDITDPGRTYDTVTKINPDLIIHAAAYTDVDGCEENFSLAYKTNTMGTRNLALACQRFDTALLYISTDYIFDGQKGQPYKEYDQPKPLSTYAKTKFWGEVHLRELLSRFYIVRTSWLFGKYGKCFPLSILNLARENKHLTVVDDQFGSPTYSRHLARAIAQLIRRTDPGLYGTYHITNQGYCSWYELAKTTLRLARSKALLSDFHLDSIKTEALKRKAPRPKFSVLANLCWKEQGFLPLPPWEEAVEEFLNKLE